MGQDELAVMVFNREFFGAQKQHVLAEVRKSVNNPFSALSWWIFKGARCYLHARCALFNVFVRNKDAPYGVLKLNIPVHSVIHLALFDAVGNAP